ncbi:YciI family protein [Gordonia neofelifaecis]|uniref:YCII-like protein n=1 Tax=Gordonia neofelifaecis NRRL B-59395 TaxID=644548 RepID=F1YI02_9ACTN|nr:YciI family protein [Gordonia neofelifaecis]EGD55556.1 YCII-like protein [Gordonia neofelifaecis NRRL B-59395]
MKYALLLMGHVDDPACGETGGADAEEFFEFDKQITAAGVVVSSFALEEERVVVHTDASGERMVASSGPFAEVQEFVGGGYIIDVADIDEAIEWARRSPGSAPGGHVEIRPLAPY